MSKKTLSAESEQKEVGMGLLCIKMDHRKVKDDITQEVYVPVITERNLNVLTGKLERHNKEEDIKACIYRQLCFNFYIEEQEESLMGMSSVDKLAIKLRFLDRIDAIYNSIYQILEEPCEEKEKKQRIQDIMERELCDAITTPITGERGVAARLSNLDGFGIQKCIDIINACNNNWDIYMKNLLCIAELEKALESELKNTLTREQKEKLVACIELVKQRDRQHYRSAFTNMCGIAEHLKKSSMVEKLLLKLNREKNFLLVEAEFWYNRSLSDLKREIEKIDSEDLAYKYPLYKVHPPRKFVYACELVFRIFSNFVVICAGTLLFVTFFLTAMEQKEKIFNREYFSDPGAFKSFPAVFAVMLIESIFINWWLYPIPKYYCYRKKHNFSILKYVIISSLLECLCLQAISIALFSKRDLNSVPVLAINWIYSNSVSKKKMYSNLFGLLIMEKLVTFVLLHMMVHYNYKMPWLSLHDWKNHIQISWMSLTFFVCSLSFFVFFYYQYDILYEIPFISKLLPFSTSVGFIDVANSFFG
ncbi:hypothetical protein NECID01_0076 [Nematocida sp. AWRm77]|nr:hypothetical protein NECID01_0076 [Nematocida sp. AWRm77]